MLDSAISSHHSCMSPMNTTSDHWISRLSQISTLSLLLHKVALVAEWTGLNSTEAGHCVTTVGNLFTSVPSGQKAGLTS